MWYSLTRGNNDRLFKLPRLSLLFTGLPYNPLTTLMNSESELLYDWWFTVNQFVLATSPLRLTTSNFIFQLNTCSYSPYVTSSLMRGWVCRLQLLLGLASAVILRSESAGLMTISYCLRFETTPTWRVRSPYLYPSGTGLLLWRTSNPVSVITRHGQRRKQFIELQSFPWEGVCLCRRYSVTAAYTFLLIICSLAADVVTR
jgi:hypothetical protein